MKMREKWYWEVGEWLRVALIHDLGGISWREHLALTREFRRERRADIAAGDAKPIYEWRCVRIM